MLFIEYKTWFYIDLHGHSAVRMDLDLFQTLSYVVLFIYQIICNFPLGKMSYCLIKPIHEHNLFLFNRTSKCKLHMELVKVRIGFNLYR